jgi:uncharacterized membrane protein YhaH (DUF805 family)
MFRFLFSPYGRISRKTYWLNWTLPYFGIMIFVTILDFAMFPIDPVRGEPPPVFQGIASLFFLWPSLAVTTKRLHDRGMTGWWNVAPLLAVMIVASMAHYYYSMQLRSPEGLSPDGQMPVPLGIALAVAGAWLFLYPAINVLFLRGQQGANEYGQDPLAPADPAAEFA